MLMHYIPEVTAVTALEEEQDDEDGTSATSDESAQKQRTYEERLAAAGIPFSE